MRGGPLALHALALATALAFALSAAPARASFDPSDPPAGAHTQTDGPRYWVGRVVVGYANEHPLQPPIDLLRAAPYALGRASDGYVGARRGGNNVWFQLADVGASGAVPVYATGLQDLCEQVVTELGARGLIGVYVSPPPNEIDPDTGADLRPEGSTDLHLVVHTGRVQGVRTFAAPALATAAPAAQEISDDHEAIAARSPLQPVGAGDPLNKDELDAYLAGLNRLPGRMVDAVVTPTLTPGVVNLDYMVAEDRPWSVSSDFSNTGTDTTGKNRQHFGYANYQLSGHDDVLLLDYITSNFTSQMNAVSGSYETRVPSVDRMRAHFGGGWNTYASDQFGFDTVVVSASDPNNSHVVHDQANFTGTEWDLNGGITASLIQLPGFFIDGDLGARYMHIEVVNLDAFADAMPFFVPELGFSLDSTGDVTRTHGRLGFQQSVPAIAGTTSSDMASFSDVSRANLDNNWRVLSLDLGGSIYLQPIFHGTRFFGPRPLRPREMAHELAWRFGGQTSLGTRVIPQAEGVLGGLMTVRGYPQSIVSGDSFANASLEYRYHIPLGLGAVTPWKLPWLGDFRPAPDRSYAMPDWDLVLVAFSDWGQVWNTNRVPGETNDALASAGLGFEIVVRRNFAVRLDYGWALLDVPSAQVNAGDTELHLSALMRY